MPVSLYKSPFTPLNLNADEKAQLKATVNEILSESQHLYESQRWDHVNSIDTSRWTLVKEREDVHVYHDRRPGATTGNKDMHLLLTVGTVTGSLNDAVYGELNPSNEAMRIKSAYVKNTLLDSAVLETIEEPTIDQPFQSMTVRWFVKGVPLHVRMMTKHRDCVYLEATGMTKLSNGERVGYHLLHSISFQSTPRLSAYDRWSLSICTLWRQASDRQVQAFTTTYIEIKDSIAVSMVVKSTADDLVSIWKVVECAQNKKLAFLMREKSGLIHSRETSTTNVDDDSCVVCATPSRSSLRGSHALCSICCHRACKKCRVKRELIFVGRDRELVKHPFRFCVKCLTSAHLLDAAIIALSEVRGSGESQVSQKIDEVSSLSSKSSTSGRAAKFSVSSTSSTSSR